VQDSEEAHGCEGPAKVDLEGKGPHGTVSFPGQPLSFPVVLGGGVGEAPAHLHTRHRPIPSTAILPVGLLLEVLIRV
jgi:hypothetical protein